jgi:hypothetical protein
MDSKDRQRRTTAATARNARDLAGPKQRRDAWRPPWHGCVRLWCIARLCPFQVTSKHASNVGEAKLGRAKDGCQGFVAANGPT